RLRHLVRRADAAHRTYALRHRAREALARRYAVQTHSGGGGEHGRVATLAEGDERDASRRRTLGRRERLWPTRRSRAYRGGRDYGRRRSRHCFRRREAPAARREGYVGFGQPLSRGPP